MTLRALAQRWGFLHKEKQEEEEHDEDPLWTAALHKDADLEVGGLACNDDQLLKEMRDAIMVWIKSMGRQILAGHLNLVNTSFPVLMFEPRSYLQKLADPWVYPDYINAAAAATDPLDRMKLLVTWVVAGMWKGFDAWKKPFNPILGETWQASLEGGISLFMEQVSHHPPVSAYQLVGPGGSWKFSGWSQPAVAPVVKFYGIKTLAKGRRRFEMPDGTSLDFYMPHYAIKGVVYAARPRAEVLGVLRIVDKANHLEAVVAFGPVKGARHRVLSRADAVCGEIYRTPGSGGGPSSLPSAAGGAAAAAHRGGALQRTATGLQPLSDAVEYEGADEASLASGSELGAGGEPDAEDEAIFNAVAAAGALGDSARAHADPAAGLRSGVASPTGAGAGPGSARCSSAGASHTPRHRPRRSLTAADMAAVAADLSAPRERKAAAAGDLAGVDGSEPTYHRNHGVSVPGVAVARIEGSWLSHLNIDSKRYWTLAETQPQHWGAPAGSVLPSDAGARRDLRALKAGDREGAQRVKEEMEVEQRNDKKLREAAGVFEHH